MIKTIELAKIYENQGFCRKALEIYRELAAQGNDSDQVESALERLESMVEDQTCGTGSEHAEKISALLEKWLRLMVLQQRLDNFKKIKSRLV